MSFDPVTFPPIEPEQVHYFQALMTRPAWSSPILIGTTIWIVGFFSNGARGIQVMKSTDNGATWLHSGSTLDVTYPTEMFSVLWDGGTGFLALTDNAAAGIAHIARFETSTETWTSDFVPSFTIGSPGYFHQIACLGRLSNGHIVCAYTRGTNSIPYYLFWDGTSWGTETRLGTDIVGHAYNETNAFFVGIATVIVDPDDVSHIFLYRINTNNAIDTDNNVQLYYCQVSSSGTLVTDTIAATPVRSLANYDFREGTPYRFLVWNDGIYRAESNKLFLVEEYYSAVGTDHSTGVIQATKPAAGVQPVFSYTSLHSSTAPADLFNYYRPGFFHSLDGTYPDIVVIVGDLNPSPGLLRLLISSDDGATWTPMTYWDASALPADINPGDTYITTQSSNGTITSAGLYFLAMADINTVASGEFGELLITGSSVVSTPTPPVFRTRQKYLWTC